MPREIDFDKLLNFTEKQTQAREAVRNYDYVLYGGALGGGKSYWLRWMMVDLLTDWAAEGKKGVRVGLFCEDYPSLKDRHFSKIQYEFPEWLGTLNKADHEYILNKEYGAGVICFRNLDDPSKYQSSEFAAVAVDELTKNPFETFLFLRTRKRWPGIERTKFIAGTNPGGIGHSWVKKLWMDKEYEPTEKEQNQFYFIQSKASDNPYLPENYYASLAGLPEAMRKAYVDGDWNLFKGQVFSEWRDSVHIVNPFPIPPGWKKYRTYDYGRTKPAACLWVAQDYDGRLWVYREYYQAGKNADEQARDILKLSGDEQYNFSVADSAIFSPTGIVDAYGTETIAETFARNGISWMPASKRRIDGWNLMHERLNHSEGKPPMILFFKNCVNSIKTIPSLIYDENKPEDVDSDGDDHCADTVRYLLVHLHDSKAEAPKTETETRILRKRGQALDFNKMYSI